MVRRVAFLIAVLLAVAGVRAITLAEELEILARLFREGLLTEGEYRAGKERVLAIPQGGHHEENEDTLLLNSDRRELQSSSALSDKLASTSMWLKSTTAQIALGPEADVSFARGSNEDGTAPHLLVRGDLKVEGDLLTVTQSGDVTPVAGDDPGAHWLALHLGAAAACRGLDASQGCCAHTVHVRTGGANGKTCTTICSETTASSGDSMQCVAEVSLNGVYGRATSDGQQVASYFNHACSGGVGEGGSEITASDSALKEGSSESFGFCCCKVAPAFTVATGGTVTTAGDYRIHTFDVVGTHTFEVSRAGGSPNNGVEYLIVAGGGGGGHEGGGGGGAGGLRHGGSGYSHAVTEKSYTVIVGDGGAGEASVNTAAGSNGNDSSFDDIVSKGGGGGGSNAELRI